MRINTLRLRATLERDEGCDLNRHEVQGIDHIGYGINLEQELPDELLDYLGVEDEDDIQVITQEQADYLLDYFVEKVSIPNCIEIYGEDVWSSLTDLRREVLINIEFNLGPNRHRGFRKMIKATKESDWAEAHAQMLDSKAARQTGERYMRLGKTFEFDDQSFLELPDFAEQMELVASTDDNLAGYTNAQLLSELARRLG